MTFFKLGFLTVTLIDLIDIMLLTWVFFKVYQYFKDTRAGQMLIGLVILLISSFIFNSFGLRGVFFISLSIIFLGRLTSFIIRLHVSQELRYMN